jgi:predicted enzyme related to lactoylglutathione lyase
MAEFEIPKNGQICWRELATHDLSAAKSFYSDLFGWDLEKSKVSTAADYFEIHSGGAVVGGMMEITEAWGENPPPSHWTSYVAVASVDETVQKILENGGSIRVPPFDAPGVGRMSMVVDPSGAGFSVIQFEVTA